MLPTLSDFACLYVIEVSRTRIKVGYSAEPAKRLALHRSLAEAHGCEPGREWISPKGSGTEEREAALIAYCIGRKTSKRFRSEYFSGVPFMAAVRIAAKLCCDEETIRAIRRDPYRLPVLTRI